MSLGKLERIADIRSIWPDEARNFTPWLERPENLSQLAEAIGYGAGGLEHLSTEQWVGDFRTDILARDALGAGEGLVLIENQFGRTNHDHLGKIITYAAGFDEARTIVWIAETFRDEHRAAVDWLNRNTRREIGIFAIEIELWRIGGSAPAPRFNIVAQPNDFLRAEPVIEVAGKTELKQLYARYWDALGATIRARKSPVKPQRGLPQQWTNFSIGRTGFTLVASCTEQSGAIRVAFETLHDGAKTAFALLEARRAEIDAAYEGPLSWDAMPGRKQTRISETLTGVNLRDEADWPRQHGWMADRLDRLYAAFRGPVLGLDLEGEGNNV